MIVEYHLFKSNICHSNLHVNRKINSNKCFYFSWKNILFMHFLFAKLHKFNFLFWKKNNALHNLNVILFPSSNASTEISFSMILLMFVSTVMFNETINEDYVWSINLLHCYVSFRKIFWFCRTITVTINEML